MEEEKKPKFRELAEISFGTLVAIDKKNRTVTIDHKDEKTGEWSTEKRYLGDEWTDEDMDSLLDYLGHDINATIIDGKVTHIESTEPD